MTGAAQLSWIRRWVAALAAVGCLTMMGACGHDPVPPQPTKSSSGPSGLASVKEGSLELTKGWVAAVSEHTMSDDHSDSSSGDDHSHDGHGSDEQNSDMDAMGTMSAGYAVIANTGTEDDQLIGASSPLAEDVEVHETVSTGGSAGTMKKVDEMPVPAGGHAALKPGGYHLMIMGLKHGLKSGSSITIDLKFASGTTMSVPFSVIDRADRPTMSPSSGD